MKKDTTITPYMKAGGCPLPAEPKKKATKPKGNRFTKFPRADLKLLLVGLPTAAIVAEINEAIAYLDATEYAPKTFTFRKIIVGKQYDFVIQAPLKSYVFAMYPNLRGTAMTITRTPALVHAAAVTPLSLFFRPVGTNQFAKVGLDIAHSIR